MSKRPAILLICISCILRVYAQPGERGFAVKADSTITKGNTYAIIIGISDYKVVPHLQYAHKDAQAFESFLLSDAGGKIPQANIETFLNENATRSNVGDAISVVARKAKPGDRVYFFFAGHGDMEDLTQVENGLLLLYNSPNGNYFGMNDDVLEILDLKRYLSPLSQRGVEMIFIVDACHSGNLKGGVEGEQQTASAMAASWGKEYKILSCQPNQLSLESAEWGGGRGLFSLELEEGMEGLADLDNNGTISMYELQNYIQTNVAKYSEGKQIPLVTGDLSKPIAKVNPATLAKLKEQKAKDYPILASANIKGNEGTYIDSLDPAGKELYYSFKKNMEEKKLIAPKDTNAFKNYRDFEKHYPNNPLVQTMRRNLAAALNDRFNGIVSPLLKGETSYSTRDQCHLAAVELDSCLHLLGEQHYMYPNLKARKLYMDAMALTWAMSGTEYNISLKPVVLNSIDLLQQSETLEPNASYTEEAMGLLYWLVFEYDKAYVEFQKFLSLRPNDFYAKYSMATTYVSLKKYDKAETLFEELVKENPSNVNLYTNLADVYFNNNKKKEALACMRKIIDSLHDKVDGYFSMGVFYSEQNNMDSAVYYYKLGIKENKDCVYCYNNLGQVFFVNNYIDSAKYYLQIIIDRDSTSPFPNFNLGTLDAINGNTKAAINKFIKGAAYSNAVDECFVTNMNLHFKKKYTVTDPKAFDEFKHTLFRFNFQYVCYTSILYACLRDSSYAGNPKRIEYIFTQMRNYKQHDVYTWYHYACYKALNNDKPAALESLEEALKLGFGNYFMLTSDDDLASIRTTPEFKALLKKYFPDR